MRNSRAKSKININYYRELFLLCSWLYYKILQYKTFKNQFAIWLFSLHDSFNLNNCEYLTNFNKVNIKEPKAIYEVIERYYYLKIKYFQVNYINNYEDIKDYKLKKSTFNEMRYRKKKSSQNADVLFLIQIMMQLKIMRQIRKRMMKKRIIMIYK